MGLVLAVKEWEWESEYWDVAGSSCVHVFGSVRCVLHTRPFLQGLMQVLENLRVSSPDAGHSGSRLCSFCDQTCSLALSKCLSVGSLC